MLSYSAKTLKTPKKASTKKTTDEKQPKNCWPAKNHEGSTVKSLKEIQSNDGRHATACLSRRLYWAINYGKETVSHEGI